ncbi:MAG: hypothetical protein AB8I08_09840 [Sandaracinaceae bacterium]
MTTGAVFDADLAYGGGSGCGALVAWYAGGASVRLRALDASGAPIGAERTYPLPEDRLVNVGVAALGTGFVLVYGAADSTASIRYRRLDATGAPTGAEQTLADMWARELEVVEDGANAWVGWRGPAPGTSIPGGLPDHLFVQSISASAIAGPLVHIATSRSDLRRIVGTGNAGVAVTEQEGPEVNDIFAIPF